MYSNKNKTRLKQGKGKTVSMSRKELWKMCNKAEEQK
jgi:hypothetical protein